MSAPRIHVVFPTVAGQLTETGDGSSARGGTATLANRTLRGDL